MITKGYIVKKVEDSTNKFLVRIPIYETVEDYAEEALYEATLSYTPGNLNAYREGDCVYLSFEDNDPSKIVILGKLFLGEEEEATAAENIATLDVNGTTQLSKDTYVGGVRVDQLFASKEDITNLQQELQSAITYRVLYDSEGNPLT